MVLDREARNFERQMEEIWRAINGVKRRVDYIEPRESVLGGFSEKTWAFDSPAGATGTFYFGGFIINYV